MSAWPSFVSREAAPTATDGHNGGVIDPAATIMLGLFLLLPVVIVAGLFVWAARKDGQEDRAVQARTGIRRRTRLGR